MNEPLKTPYECIDPVLGEQIWRLEQPDLEASVRAALEAHVSACHACRLVVHLDSAMRDLALSGRLTATASSSEPRLSESRPHRLRRRGRLLAGLALAACLMLIVTLPPRPAGEPPSVRGSDETRFLRPVEGEIITSGRPTFRWTPVVGASRYIVELRDQDGRSVWRGESSSPEITLTGTVDLATGREYRALLSTQPADLVLPGHVSVAFRRDSAWLMILHQMRWANPLLQLAGVLCLAVLVLLSVGRRHGGRTGRLR